MPKAKGLSINTPQVHPFPAPKLGGDLGTGLDFESTPSEMISGHNVYQTGDSTHDGQTPSSKIVSPSKVIKRVKTN